MDEVDLNLARKETLALVLAGGKGSRLKNLTGTQAKPAVPFGGKFRIIDFPLSNCINSGKAYAYDATDCFIGTIDSVQSYYDISMSLLDKDTKRKLFVNDRPIYTKERDDMPTLYGHESKINNSLIADGCEINGEVENSIIFKGVKVEKGAVVKNSILMQDTVIGENTKVNYIIADKNVNVKSGVELSGAENFPVSLSKDTRI